MTSDQRRTPNLRVVPATSDNKAREIAQQLDHLRDKALALQFELSRIDRAIAAQCTWQQKASR